MDKLPEQYIGAQSPFLEEQETDEMLNTLPGRVVGF
jgi:hypothetical protein